MDCRTALEILEVARPDGEDFSDPELASALAYVRAHPECAEILRSRQALDRTIGSAMQDVPVPADLKANVLEALERSGEPAGANADVVTPDRATDFGNPPSEPADGRTGDVRRRMSRQIIERLAVAVAACLLIAGLAWWLLPDSGPAVTLQTVRESIPTNLQNQPEFRGEFDPQLPDGVWQFGHVAFNEAPRRFRTPGADRDLGALFAFRVRGPRGATVNGTLLVMPAQFVADPPAADSFHAAEMHYNRAGTHATVAWVGSEGRWMYVCMVPVKDQAPERLQRALEIPTA